MSGDWQGLLRSVAPLVGTALGGPLGGAAASFLADKLGLQDKTVKAVTDVLSSGRLSADQVLAVKLAEIEFAKFCKTHSIDLQKISSEDRGDARKMQTATRSIMPAVLTVMITVGFFGVLFWMLYDPDVVNSPPLLIMLGSLGTAWTAACAFWFGSTAGSSAKTQLLADSIPARART